ncbi:MAG TPA: class I SAM-dependent methyltransferase [Thermoanaerobaculia bacterium]|nr:class I SAM-dependent methyltransferase [Thermoanaerobaculia bacterium]
MTSGSRVVVRAPRVERALARAIARRCSADTVLLGRRFDALLARLEDDGVVVARSEPDDGFADLVGSDERHQTVVVARLLEHLDQERALPLLRQAYSRVAPGGRLLVCVPHGAVSDAPPGQRRFDRTSLKRLLKEIDQPKVFTDQPYGWLLMGVDRDPPLERTVAERCRVIAGLCHGAVLELGCGPGHLSAEIAGRGLEVTGVDKNAGKIETAHRRYPSIRFERADILELPEERSFDTVVLAEVLEHVDAEVGDRILEKAWALVAAGGRLVVSVPNEDCIPHRNHLREFTIGDLRRRLAAFGRPRVVSDQPFKWLLAFVERSSAAS